MEYEGLIIRPPSEASSLILQISVGCPHNACTFCPAYKSKTFRIKEFHEIQAALRSVAPESREKVRRIFLCDGDPMGVPHDALVEVLDCCMSGCVNLQRIGIYTRADTVLKKSSSQLDELKKRKLGICYMGLESGDNHTLKSIRKGITAEQMTDAADRINDAGIKLNVTVLLGVAGKDRSRIHAEETMRVLNSMQPDHIGALTLMLVPGTPLHAAAMAGAFEMPDKLGLVRELRDMIAVSELRRCLFFSNHASNYYAVRARLPRDRERVLKELDAIVDQKNLGALRDESLRAL